MDRQIKKKKWTVKRIVTWGGGSILAILVIYNLFFVDHMSTLAVARERLTLSEVEQGLYLDFILANGNVQPLNTVYLDAVEGGQVEEIFVQEGDLLAAGDPILRLDNTSLRMDIMYREAEQFQQINNLQNTRLTMEQRSLDLRGQLLQLDLQTGEASRQYERDSTLYVKSLISEFDYQDSRDNYIYLTKRRELTLENHRTDSVFRNQQIEQLEMGVERMRENLTVVKQRLDRLTLRAPISGHLTSLNAELGQSMAPGQRTGQIDRLDGFKIRGSIDEHYIARIDRGLRGEFDFAGSTHELRITRVYPEVSGGRFEVDMEFNSRIPDGLRRGQTVRLNIELGQPSDAKLVSRGGFYQSTGGQWVFVVNEDTTEAVRVQIQIGRQNREHYEVLNGLSPGDLVITSSYETFGDVERLTIRN
jgi:HlyD family secretion protein